MKHYRIAATTLKVRTAPSSSADVITTLPKGAEFFGSREQPGSINPRQTWAERFSGGWLCVKDSTHRYCDEIPMPIPEPLPEATPPAGNHEQRISDLERKVEILGAFVAAHKND